MLLHHIFSLRCVVINLSTEDEQHQNTINNLHTLSWKKDHIKLLWKENATTERIFNSLDWLSTNADENDVVVFSVDAHGTYSKGAFGIWPSDGYEQGIITVDELDHKFDVINAKGLCLIFDCCLAGNFVDSHGNSYPVVHDKKTIFRRLVIEGVEEQGAE